MKKFLIISAIILGFFLMSCVAMQPKEEVSQIPTLEDAFGFVDPKADGGIDPSEFISWEIIDTHVIAIKELFLHVCHHLVSPDKNAIVKEVHAVIAINPSTMVVYFTRYSYRTNGKVISFSWDANKGIFTRELNKSYKYGETI